MATFLQGRRIRTAQDTRTPPIIDTIFEQIIHNTSAFDNLVAITNLLNEDNKRQGVAYSAITCLSPHPPAEHSNHKWASRQHDMMRKKDKERRDGRNRRRGNTSLFSQIPHILAPPAVSYMSHVPERTGYSPTYLSQLAVQRQRQR